MTRGKYAVRAAQDRAESAALKADRTAQKLAEEKQTHAAERAALKTRVEVLSSQLTGEVKAMAAAEVKRTEEEWAARLAAEQQRHREAALKVFDLMGRVIVHDGVGAIVGIAGEALPELIADLAELLGVPAGRAEEAAMQRSAVKDSRITRRATASKIRAAASGQTYTVVGRSR